METKKSLTDHVKQNAKTIDLSFTKSQVLWSPELISTIPIELQNDPLVSMLVKFYNSAYFHEHSYAVRTIRTKKKSFDILIEHVLAPVGFTPENVLFEFIKTLREKFDNREGSISSFYHALTPPIFLLGGHGTCNSRKKREALNKRIRFTNEEISIAQRLCLRENRPSLSRLEKSSKPDLVTHLRLEQNGHEIISSLRSFSSWYIKEWDKIRKSINTHCPSLVDQLNEYIEANPHKKDTPIFQEYIGVSSSPHYILDIIFRIVKTIKHPFLTERFVTNYLNVLHRYNGVPPSEAMRSIYDMENHKSSASSFDLLDELEQHYAYQAKHLRYSRSGKVGELFKRHERVRCATNKWRGGIGSVISIVELLGITPEEEICFAWLLASDRHQPSNIARMLPGDIEETSNSLTTVISPKSVKFRSGRLAGTSYPKGEVYKNNSVIFDAIKLYKSQILYSYQQGYFEAASSTEFTGPILPRVTSKNSTASLENHYFRIYKNVRNSFQLFLCSMTGSMSNNLAIKANPKHAVWLEVMEAAARLSKPKSGTSGFKPLSCDYIQRQSVNNMLTSSMSTSAITSKETTDFTPDTEEQEYIRKIKAANHNHSSKVRSEIYLDKAPNHVTLHATTKFAARVGDEMIRMAIPLAEHMASITKAMTLSEARMLLGLENDSKHDFDICSEHNEILELAKLNNFDVDDAGVASNQRQNIILKTPLTVALIKAKLKSLDSQISRLLESNENRAKIVIAQRIYLHLVLDELFTKKEIHQADKMYGDYEFPMNDILV